MIPSPSIALMFAPSAKYITPSLLIAIPINNNKLPAM